jgi:hypothetical protein
MKLLKLVEKNTKKIKWYDISLLKLDVIFFTLFLITFWPAFRNLVLGIEWFWYLAIAVVLAVPLLKKMCS